MSVYVSSLKVSNKLNATSMFNLNFELKIQEQDLHLIFFKTVSIRIDSTFKHTP